MDKPKTYISRRTIIDYAFLKIKNNNAFGALNANRNTPTG